MNTHYRILSFIILFLWALGSAQAITQITKDNYSDFGFTDENFVDFYAITNADDLFEFAELVNAGKSSINGVLTSDIDCESKEWIPIGVTTGHSVGVFYEGIFDGNYHEIRNFVITKSYFYSGLFGGLNNNVVIRNLGVINVDIKNSKKAAGVIAGGTYLDNYTYDITGKITNCYVDSINIEGINNDDNGGAIVGGIWRSAKTFTISNCLVGPNVSISKFEYKGCVVGMAECSVSNTYRSEKLLSLNKIGNGNDGIEKDFSTGELCYLLNGSTSDSSSIWFQRLGGDEIDVMPNFVHKDAFVYCNKKYTCTDQLISTEYSNENLCETHSHNYVNGVCTYCGDAELGLTFITKENYAEYGFTDTTYVGYFPITDTSSLALFANSVNYGKNAMNGVLINDIDFSGHTEMIGSNDYFFKGVFDGQNHTITVAYKRDEPEDVRVGLFLTLEDATIQNLRVDGSVFAGEGCRDAGGFANCSRGNTKFKNCISAVDIVSSYSCGKYDNRSDNGLIGGIVAWVAEGSVSLENCAFVGSVSGDGKNYFAGLVGGNTTIDVTLSACYVMANVDAPNMISKTFCYFVKNCTYNNCFYSNALGEAQGTKVAEQMFENGMLCLKLNNNAENPDWRQTVGVDAYPNFLSNEIPNLFGSLITITAENYSDYGFADESFVGYYAITNADDLALFSNMVNSGLNTANAVLINNIDFSAHKEMIGCADSYYSGVFDGQNYTITLNYDFTDTVGSVGLFYGIDGATIQKLRVEGSIKGGEGVRDIGGIACFSRGKSNFNNCISAVDIRSNYKYGVHDTYYGNGCIGGICSWVPSGSVTLRNCAFIGSISGSGQENCAGLVYGGTDGVQLGIYTSYVDAVGSGLNMSYKTLYYTAYFSFINTCYYVNALGTAQGTKASVESMKNGELCCLLNYGTNDWKQTFGERPDFTGSEMYSVSSYNTTVNVKISRPSGKGEETYLYRTISGTAIDGVNFDGVSGRYTFKDGETEAFIPITIRNYSSSVYSYVLKGSNLYFYLESWKEDVYHYASKHSFSSIFLSKNEAPSDAYTRFGSYVNLTTDGGWCRNGSGTNDYFSMSDVVTKMVPADILNYIKAVNQSCTYVTHSVVDLKQEDDGYVNLEIYLDGKLIGSRYDMDLADGWHTHDIGKNAKNELPSTSKQLRYRFVAHGHGDNDYDIGAIAIKLLSITDKVGPSIKYMCLNTDFSYVTGDVVVFSIAFDEIVKVANPNNLKANVLIGDKAYTFNYVGGSGTSVLSFKANVELVDEKQLKGFVFKSLTGSSIYDMNSNSAKITEKTIKDFIINNKYKIDYDCADGVVKEEYRNDQIPTFYYVYDSPSPLLSNKEIIKSGYKLYGWNRSGYDNLFTELNGDVYGNIALKAEWGVDCNVEPKITVANASCFDKNDGSISVEFDSECTISWVNRTETTPTIENLGRGTYSFIYTQLNNGCLGVDTVVVESPAQIKVNFADTILPSCEMNNGQITAVIDNRQLYDYKFEWSNGSTSNILKNAAAGKYSLLVSQSDVCSARFDVELQNPERSTITLDSIYDTYCGKTDGAIYVSVDNFVNSYAWSNGAETEDLENLEYGNYTLTITDINNCKSIADFEVSMLEIPQPSLSLVTVSQETGKNLVVWLKNSFEAIDSYVIYRESDIKDVFSPIDTIDYSVNSIYEDLEANPMTRSWSYKIAALDLCGNSTELSEKHTTMHVQKNKSENDNEINIAWNHYEGIEYDTYYVYRETTTDGSPSVDVIDSIPANLTSYTAIIPAEGKSKFYVSIKLPNLIDPVGNLKFESGPFSMALSNIAEAKMINPDNIVMIENTKIYSNKGRLVVENAVDDVMNVFDSLGRLIYSGLPNSIDLPTGLYLVQIGSITEKIVVK